MLRVRLIAIIFLGLFAGPGIEAYSQAKELSDLFTCISGEDSREKVDCYIELASIYRQLNKDSALIFCDEAYSISKEIEYIEGAWGALYKKCQTLADMGDIQGAIVLGKRCLSVADSIKDERRTGQSYFKLAGLYEEVGQKNSAIQYYVYALQIFKERKDTNALVAIYNGLGNFYDGNSVLDSAVYYYHLAVDLCELTGFDLALGRILGNLGGIYKDLQDYYNAERYTLLALEYNIQNDDFNEIPKRYSLLGSIESGRGNYRAAVAYYTKADSVLKKVGDSLTMMNVALNKASVYFDMGREDLALPVFNTVATYYRRQNFVQGLMALWQNLADVYMQSGSADKALLYYDSIIELARINMDMSQIRAAYENIYWLHHDQGNYKQALEAYIQYEVYSDSIFDLEKAKLINDLRFKYEKEKDQLAILELEHQNLQKTKERNLLVFVVLGITLLAIIILAFLIYNHRKNKIIAAQQIKQLEEEKKHLAARFLVEGEERERKRVAMELHDNLGVLLSATKMQFSEIRDKNPDNAELITKATKYLEQASTDVRKISHNLMPGLLTKLGLFEALEELFENLDDQDEIDAFMEVVGPKSRLEENIEIMVYRVMQEAVNNTLKHAEASKIDLSMIVDEEELNISYADNGNGFDVDNTLKKKTMGMQNIISRVKFLNGKISIRSDKGEGTVIRICIPLAEGNCSGLPEES